MGNGEGTGKGRPRVTRQGKREDIGGQFFRSSWEANVARWLTHRGVEWKYEPTTFWFTKITRGTRFYTPDFYLPQEDRYLEIKGWWDSKSRTRMKRMAKYYPDIKVEVIDAKAYRVISAQYCEIIPNWEKSKVELDKLPESRNRQGMAGGKEVIDSPDRMNDRVVVDPPSLPAKSGGGILPSKRATQAMARKLTRRKKG